MPVCARSRWTWCIRPLHVCHRGVASLFFRFEVKPESVDSPGLEDFYCAVDESRYFLEVSAST